ncbi:MAG: hypothetical protein GY838_08890 [bacterium]|nr:hypothetical protein [bacterium]
MAMYSADNLDVARPGEDFVNGLFEIVVCRWKLIAICIIAGAVLAVAIRASGPVRYTATATILPQGNDRGGSGILGALAVQSGLNFGNAAGNEEIFGRIIESRTALAHLIEKKWSHRRFSEPVSLARILGLDADATENAGHIEEERLLAVLRRRVIDFERDPSTGFMSLRVTIPEDPQLAADIANALVHVLEDFNDKGRFSRARNQREMIEARLVEVERDLEMSSTELSDFLDNNRSYASSPTLTMEYARLEREVSADGLVWQELKRQLEVARIDEMRNTLTVDVLDSAVAPVRPDRYGLVFTIIVGCIIGCIAAVLIVAILALSGQQRVRTVD